MDAVLCRKQLVDVFVKIVTAMNPAVLISENLKLDKNTLYVSGKGYDIKGYNINLIGFGKAVLGMASQCEKILGKRLKQGVICVPEGIQKFFENNPNMCLKTDSIIQVYEGARNNLPDENSETGSNAIIDLVKTFDPKKDYAIVLISGGGSALFTKPIEGITLTEKKNLVFLISTAGANIVELNTVRKKVSQVKGGGLASLLYPVKTISLILSDVVNESLDFIASGPTIPNTDSSDAAINVIKKYELTDKIPQHILKLLAENNPSEKNKISNIDNYIIGNNVKALKVAEKLLEAISYKTIILSSKIEGFVQNVADLYINLLIEIINFVNSNGNYNISFPKNIKPFDTESFFEDKLILKINEVMKEVFCDKKKFAIICGGEPVVNVQGKGKGGRNQELTLLMLSRFYNLRSKFSDFFMKYEVTFLSAGTDGIDGPTDIAGAVVDTTVFDDFNINDSSINMYLKNNDSYNFYTNLLNDSYIIRTGHTGTNVMDIHLIAIHEKNKENHYIK